MPASMFLCLYMFNIKNASCHILSILYNFLLYTINNNNNNNNTVASHAYKLLIPKKD